MRLRINHLDMILKARKSIDQIDISSRIIDLRITCQQTPMRYTFFVTHQWITTQKTLVG